MIKSHQQETCR